MTDDNEWRDAVKGMFGTSNTDTDNTADELAPARTNIAPKEGQRVTPGNDDDADMRAYARELFGRANTDVY